MFFFCGWLLWRYREKLNQFTRHWVLSLLIGNFLVLPVMLGLIDDMLKALQGLKSLPGAGQHAATCFSSALYTWLMIAGLMGAFRHWFHRERRWVRYLADASYWCYLWHLTPIVALQILLASSPLPGVLKFLIIIGTSMAILLASYEWCVRYTLIGAMLNGRKYRSK